MSKVVVVGGGNIGTLLFAELTHKNPNCQVYLQTRDLSNWASSIQVTDHNCQVEYSISTDKVVDYVIDDADYYFFTIPKNALQNVVIKYIEQVKSNAVFVFVPGTGGVEFLYSQVQKKPISFVGMQRVPYIVRLNQYGRSVAKLSVKEQLFCSGIGIGDFTFIDQLLGIPTVSLDNYLCVTLTPSNPILHTSRLYAMFSSRPIDEAYDHNILFYEEWNDFSSDMLIKMDGELRKTCDKIEGLNLQQVVSLKIHYQSPTVEAMTKKISSIVAFKGITSPMKKTEKGYVADVGNRYFLEDFDYGLVIIKAIAEIASVDTPNIDRVLRWYGSISGKEILDGKSLNRRKELLIPQNYGITTMEQLVEFYK